MNIIKDIFIRLPMMLVCLSIAVLLCIFASILHKDIVLSLFDIWINDVTFNHCFLVIPLVIWLFYRKFMVLCQNVVRFEFRLIPLVFLAGIFAQIFYHIGINLFSQIMFVILLQLIIVAVIGFEACRKVIYPIGSLLFLVPFGTEFVVPLQNSIAKFVTFLTPYFGVEIIRSGIHLHTDRIDFYVAEACAGLRFLIANIFVMSIYGYLSFKTLKIKSYFFLISIIFPLIGNLFRVMLIVLIGYYSSGRYAVGFDHIVYGWGFFTVIAFLNFLVGEKLMKHEATHLSQEQKSEETLFETWSQLSSYNKKTIFNIGAFPVIMISLILPIIISYQIFMVTPTGALKLPKEISQLSKIGSHTNQDRFTFKKFDEHNEWQITPNIFAGYYHYQTQNADKDVLNSLYRFYDEARWLWQSEKNIEISGKPWKILVSGYGQNKRVIFYHYYDVSGKSYNSLILAKLGFLKQVLTKGTTAGGVLYYAYEGIYTDGIEAEIIGRIKK